MVEVVFLQQIGHTFLVAVFLRDILGGFIHLCRLNEVHGVTLLEVVVGLRVPGADCLAGLPIDILGSKLRIRRDLCLEVCVGSIAGEGEVLGGFHRNFDVAVDDFCGKNALGELCAAAVDDENVLAVLIL